MAGEGLREENDGKKERGKESRMGSSNLGTVDLGFNHSLRPADIKTL